MDDIYRRASALIEQGWCKYVVEDTSYNGLTRHCLIGAVGQAWANSPYALLRNSYDGVRRTEIVKQLAAACDCKPHTMYIGQWNDEPGRTQQQVLELLDTLIDNT